jgi:hypothetical protein
MKRAFLAATAALRIGDIYIWLDHAVVARLRAMRGPGEPQPPIPPAAPPQSRR